MGLLSSAWAFVKSVGPFVTQLVKKVYEVCTTDSAASAYDNLEKIINRRNASQSPPSDGIPDFYGNAGAKMLQLEKKVSQANQVLVRQQAELEETKRIMALQFGLTRLRSSADLIDRSREWTH